MPAIPKRSETDVDATFDAVVYSVLDREGCGLVPRTWLDTLAAATQGKVVVALRCTNRLLQRLRIEVADSVGQPGNALGHWYANVVTINRALFVLAISERSLLSVVVPGTPFSTLPARVPQALAELLRNLSVPEREVVRELTAMSPLTVATTASRKVLGCLNQYAFELEVDFHYNPGRTLLERELWLSDNISSAIRYSHPRDLALELLAAEGSQ